MSDAAISRDLPQVLTGVSTGVSKTGDSSTSGGYKADDSDDSGHAQSLERAREGGALSVDLKEQTPRPPEGLTRLRCGGSAPLPCTPQAARSRAEGRRAHASFLLHSSCTPPIT